MGQIAPMRVPRFLSAALGSLLFLALAVILLDPIPLFSDIANSVRLRLQLPPATARWQSSGPSTYRIHVKGSVPLACLVDGELTVHDGRLVDVRMREDPFSPDSPLLPVDPARWQRPGCSYQDLTVESMLERVRLGVEGAGLFGLPVAVRFDEGLGYITEYRLVRASRGGVFGYTLSECCTWFEFDSLTIADP
jgi:hypothetical protein